MSDEIVDALGELLFGFADELAVGGLKLGFMAAKVAYNAMHDSRSPEEVLNQLISTGQFDEAEKYVHGLDLAYSSKTDVLNQIAEIQRNYKLRMAHVREWNEKLNSLLNQGKDQEAIRFVESLDLPGDKKSGIISSIRDAARKRDERNREAEKWMQKLASLVSQGKVRQAKKYVKSLPVDSSTKKAILSKL